MPKYKLTREADIDLDGIWEYTYKQWGKNQANKYLTKLEERFFTLAENPYWGK
jgi:toxin ParE1/3/4